MMQEVAADQAIMQLMDARGTLMELKVIFLYKFIKQALEIWLIFCMIQSVQCILPIQAIFVDIHLLPVAL